MADKYYRLVCFLVNITPQPLRELFLQYTKTDPKFSTCSTIDACLKLMKQQIILLKKKKVIRQVQWELLFPSAPGKLVDETSWDITLVILLIEEFYGNKLQQVEEDAISKIREIRNRLQHFAETSIDDADFDNMWTTLECATIDIAKQIQPSPMYVNAIKEYIDKTKINNMPNLGDSLRYFYETIIIQMKSDMEDMKEKIAQLRSATEECRSVLNESTEVLDGPTGKKVKRLKTVDRFLKRLAEKFTMSMREDLPRNFETPPAVTDINTKLRKRHHVVVTGSRGSRYLEAALASLKNMGYNNNRCVEMNNSCDWRHIDPDEVDFVLCREPFGDVMFDEDKTKAMADIFNSMLQTAKTTEKGKHIDIMIVSEMEILQQVLEFREHDLLGEMVKVNQPTTESDPADLTGLCGNLDSDFDQATRNQLDLTAAFVKRYKSYNLHPASVLEKAKATLKREKVIVLTGPTKCGKTSLAVTLASRYQKNQFLVLNKPDDMKLIKIGSICTVLVEDFAGKSSYSGTYAEAWLREFEMLYSAVCSGKLNVMITCEKRILLKCIEKNGRHPLLNETNTVILWPFRRTIKQEPTDAGDTTFATHVVQNYSLEMETQNTSSYTTVKKIQTHTINLPNNVVPFYDKGFCRLPDRSFLVLAVISDTNYDSIFSLSLGKIVACSVSPDFEYQCNYSTDIKYDYNSYNVCCTDSGDVVIAVRDKISLYRIADESLQRIKSTDLESFYTNVSYHMNRIYCSDQKSTLILDADLNIKKEVQISDIQSENFVPCSLHKYFNIHFNSDDHENCIICVDFKFNQVIHLRKIGFKPMLICAATEGSVFVFGVQAESFKILQVNSDMAVLSEICIERKQANQINLLEKRKMVFDRDNSRLVICVWNNVDTLCYALYLE